MPKADKKKVSKNRKLAQLRNKLYEELFDAKEKFVKHLLWSMDATIVCPACFVETVKNEDGKVIEKRIVPGKAKDSQGKCKLCHNDGFVPDKPQRNWASDQLGHRLAPNLKGIEVGDGEEEETQQIETEAKKISDADLDKELGIKFKDE
jgi:hypothetical protein